MMKKELLSLMLLGIFTQAAAAEHWPQFRGNAARSGYTEEPLSASLSLRWVYKPSNPPQPAWVAEDTRMPFDYAYFTVISNGLVFFGSSADCKVYALDAATGKERWSFFTDGPVRFSPAVWKDRVFVTSDDGHLYCLAAKTGKLLWKKYGGPNKDMLLGNARMVSRWPARGAPTVLDDVVYFCAGIWPSEGIFIYALDPQTGDVLWVNDSSGDIRMNQPHKTARAKSGVSAQGYLAAAGDTLLIPTGRATPAAFNRIDGNFRYFHLQKQGAGWGKKKGSGPFITVIDGVTFNNDDLFRTQDGKFLVRGIPATAVAAFPEHIVFAAGNEIKAIKRTELLTEKEAVDRKGEKVTKIVLNDPAWTIACSEPVGSALIGAGRTIIVGTSSHKVITADVESRSVVTTAELDGVPLGLAAADGRLYVSTDRGTIYCFDPAPIVAHPGQPSSDVDGHKSHLNWCGAAEEIINKTGIREGYCLDLGCGDGRLAYELAKRTNLHICAVESDPNMVVRARKLLDAAGLYGIRVTVLQRDLSDTGLPNYFANLIVSGNSVKNGVNVVPRDEMFRVQRPYGGVICIGKAGEMAQTVRGPLAGAGNWTHQYCNAANTGCSTDALVKAPLEMLWFTDNDFEMPSRHGRGPAPLFWNGLLFIEGLHGIRALDAYNGHVFWQYPLKDILKDYDQEHLNGAAVTGSNFCIDEGTLYVRIENRCLRLDAVTGKKLGEIKAPLHPDGRVGTWGYIACENGTVYGSGSNEEHVVKYAFGRADMSKMFSESVFFFALDAKTGNPKWTYKPEHSIRNNSIAIAGGYVYLIDRPPAMRDRLERDVAERRGEDIPEHPTGTLVALNAADGKLAWKTSKDIYGTMLALSIEHNVLLMAYQKTNFRLKSEIGGRMTAFRASDGKRLWDVKANYNRCRPLLNGRTIYAQPGAWDLLTGRQKDLRFDRSYGCGILAGSTHLLAYRSATLGYLDLSSNKGTENYGGIRPGCWINTIPAGGLLLVPEAAHKCTCSYLIKATIALQPMQ